MKMLKKILIFAYIALFIPFFVGCDYFTFTTQNSNQTQTISTTMPTTVNGTITYSDSDYDTFPTYTSPTYSLTNVAEYNQVLYNTKTLIRHANIQVVASIYDERLPFPWSSQTEKFIIGTTYGSGVVFKKDDAYYYAITNYHVVDPEEYKADYTIKTYSDSEYSSAELVAYDPDLDLAVLKFAINDRSDVTMLNITNRLYYKFNVGELVMAVGNPQSLINNVTFGEFNGMETIDNYDYKVIYHDASIHEGSSGGALVDVDGNLLGINTWGLESNDLYSFSIPNYIVYQFLVNNGLMS